MGLNDEAFSSLAPLPGYFNDGNMRCANRCTFLFLLSLHEGNYSFESKMGFNPHFLSMVASAL
jgi:hypothetical protein